MQREDNRAREGRNDRPWSNRLLFTTELHPLASAVAEAREAGRPLLDLIDTNPTRCGFSYAANAVLQPLAAPAALRYDADPLGMLAARTAVASAYYAPRGIDISPDRILLTTSTSEAYGYLFRLLCDPDDEVMVPRPSYPLFDMLARMEDVRLRPYPLLLHDDWRIDFAALEAQLTPRTRAIVAVHPNNPTGHFVDAQDRLELDRLAARNGLALIVDEVFLDYRLDAGVAVSFAAGTSEALTFVLSGLSKVAALPQMKLAWTVLCGPDWLRAEALSRLEFIADTYLSVQAPVQHALPRWLALAPGMQAQLRERSLANLAELDVAVRRCPLLSHLPCEGGWSVLLRCPAMEPDDELALRLLQAGVVMHPGSFYGLPSQGWLVISTIVPTEIFRKGVAEIVTAVAEYAKVEPAESLPARRGQ